MIPRAALALAAAAALALAGCGGGHKTSTESPAKANFIKRADAICAGGNQAVASYEAKISALISQADSTKFFSQAPGLIHKATAVTRKYVDQLDAVPAPAADKAKLDAWRATVRHQVDLLDTTAEAIQAKDTQRVQALSNQVDSLNKRNDAFASAYGMKACSETPG